MKKICKLINEPLAKAAACFMKYICYFVMVFFMMTLVLSFMGRQAFTLHTSTGTYEGAIYSEEDHSRTSRSLTAYSEDDIRVTAGKGDKIDLITHIGLSVMYAVHVIPLIICYWFLSRVFNNVSKGRIFIEKNALYLLYYGLIQIAVAILAPFIKLFIGCLANLFTDSTIHISTGQDLLNDAIINIAFIVAAYIIHYGIHLQDEADHTL